MLVKRLGRYIGYSAIVVFALAVLGAFVPKIPLLGPIGPVLLSPFGPWIVIISLAGLAGNVAAWRKTGRRAAIVLASIAAFVVVGATVIAARQIALSRANGVHIDLAQTLWLKPSLRNNTPPVLENYSSFDGAPLPLAIYSPSVAKKGQLSPILVYVHGGGWGAGTLHARESDMRWFADRGYLVISIEYALSSEKRHLWDTVPPQIGCALVWIADNAGRLSGDTSRTAFIGESAGGNLVLDVSYMANAGSLKPSCPGKLPRIAATVALYPIVDAVRLYNNDDLNVAHFAREMATYYTGGTPEQYPERYAEVSPITHISSAAPPTLILFGLSDHLLPPGPVFELASKARATGVEMRVIAVPQAEHSFDLMSGSIGNQLVRYATLHFLGEHGLAQ